MGLILCCVRGGETSAETQKRSIALAKKHNHEIAFFMVYDVEFMVHANYALRSDVVSDEMLEMCQFMLDMAIERAAEQGVNARSIIRSGSFPEQLREVVKELVPDLVILGHPGTDAGPERLEKIQALCRMLQAELNIEFRILPEIEPSSAG